MANLSFIPESNSLNNPPAPRAENTYTLYLNLIERAYLIRTLSGAIQIHSDNNATALLAKLDKLQPLNVSSNELSTLYALKMDLNEKTDFSNRVSADLGTLIQAKPKQREKMEQILKSLQAARTALDAKNITLRIQANQPSAASFEQAEFLEKTVQQYEEEAEQVEQASEELDETIGEATVVLQKLKALQSDKSSDLIQQSQAK